MSDNKKKESPVIHVKVTVSTAVNPSTGEIEYIPKYHPEVISVTEPDTILSFKLHKPTPDDVIISAVARRPADNTQLSTPSISTNGKMVTLTDVNTEKQTLNLDFDFASKKGGKTTMLKEPSASLLVSDYPEILNEPPP
jgi:hypothetical protein